MVIAANVLQFSGESQQQPLLNLGPPQRGPPNSQHALFIFQHKPPCGTRWDVLTLTVSTASQSKTNRLVNPTHVRQNKTGQIIDISPSISEG